MSPLFYAVYSCDFCQKYVYERLGTHHSHFHACTGTAVLHTIIPIALLSSKLNYPQPELFGSNSRSEHLFPEPGLVRCGYCQRDIPRRYIAYHVLYCRSKLQFYIQAEEESHKNDAHKHFLSVPAIRIEFSIFHFI